MNASSVTEGISVADVSVKVMKKSRPRPSDIRTRPSKMSAQAMYMKMSRNTRFLRGALFIRSRTDSLVFRV